MQAYNEIYEWMIRLVNENRVGSSSEHPSETDVVLQILTSHNNAVKQIKYRDCVPTSLGSINFVANASDVETLVVDFTLRFSYFELV